VGWYAGRPLDVHVPFGMGKLERGLVN